MTLLRLTPAMATHKGMRRRQNEDSVDYKYPTDVNQLETYGALFVVADGVGGLSAGDQASQMAVKQVIEYYYAGDADISAEERLATAFHRTNEDVFKSLKREAATTLVAVVILNEQVVAASIGDSIIYRIRGEQIDQLNEEDVVHTIGKNEGALTKAIGYRETLEVETISGTAQEGDKFLLCSDGITRYLKPEQLANLSDLRDPRDSVRRMLNQANAAGGADNVTALLVHIGEEIDEEEFAKHQKKLSVRVAVDTDPMIKLDDTKPHTQIPLSAPERARQTEDKIESQLSQTDYESQRSPTPSKIQAEPEATGNNNMLILLGVAVIVIGALIIGGGLVLLGNPDSNQTEQAPTEAVIETEVTSPTASDVTEIIEDLGEPQKGDIIILSDRVLTLARIDDDVAAFNAKVGTNYIIDEIFTDTEGQLWYHLLDQESNQSGWVLASDLPDYQLQRD